MLNKNVSDVNSIFSVFIYKVHDDLLFYNTVVYNEMQVVDPLCYSQNKNHMNPLIFFVGDKLRNLSLLLCMNTV